VSRDQRSSHTDADRGRAIRFLADAEGWIGPPDAATVTAFVSGVCAVQMNVPMAQALCAKHAQIAAEALAFVLSHGRRPRA